MNNYIKRLIIRMFLLLFIILFSQDILFPILEFLTVKLSYIFLLPLKPILINPTTMVVKSQLVEIVPACVALSAYILLYILILTTKDIHKEELIKLFIIGTLSILIINILRIDILIYMLTLMGSRLFETVHLFIWKILSGVVVVAIWIILTRKYKITSIPIYDDVKYLIKQIR